MSRDFRNIPYSPWRGTPQSVDISLCKPTRSPQAMVVSIDWTTGLYGPAVKVDLAPQGASQPLDKIVALKVDNSGNATGLYIQFPDTSDVITILPFSIVTVPVLTNQMTFVVYLADPNVLTPVVRIHAMNVYVDPSQELEKVVVTPQAANSFGAVSEYALGDVADIAVINLTSTAPLTIFTAPPPLVGATQNLIITSITASCFACYNMTAVEAFIRLRDAFGTIIRQWSFGVKSDLAMYGSTTLEQASGMQLFLAGSAAPYTITNMVALTAGKFSIAIESTRTSLI